MQLYFLATILAATAAEPDPRILRLITADTKMVTGIDFERFANTKLAAQFPVPIAFFFPNVSPEDLHIQHIVTIGVPNEPSLTVIIGVVPPKPAKRHERWLASSPEPGFLFIGEGETVQAALAAWRDSRRKPPPLAHWEVPRQNVREFAAGIRFRAQNQCFAGVKLATSEDAIAANALARWLPAVLQRRNSQLAALVDAASDVQSRQNGTSVELTFLLSEDAIPAPSQ